MLVTVSQLLPRQLFVFHKVEESVSTEEGRRVGTCLMLTLSLGWTLREPPSRKLLGRLLWES